MSNTPQLNTSIQQVVQPAPPVIQIGQMEALIAIVVFLVGLGISWGTLKSKIEHISSSIKDKIEPDLKNVRERFAALEGSLGKTFAGASPIKLLAKGEEILNHGGIKNYIDSNKIGLLSEFKLVCEMKNQYDIQEQAFVFFDKKDFGVFEETFKKVAFDYGMSIDTIKRIGGIYFRDICLSEAGFKPEDLDKPKKSDA